MNRTQNTRSTPPIGQEYGPAAVDRYTENARLARYNLATVRAEWTRHKRGCPACNSWQAAATELPLCHQGQMITGRRRRLAADEGKWLRMAEIAANPPSTLF